MSRSPHDRTPRPNTGEQWRALGFFHEPDAARRVWHFTGSRNGLAQFAEMLESLAAQSSPGRGDAVAVGPFEDLHLRRWERAGIDDESVYGPPEALTGLAGLVRRRLQDAGPGTVFEIRHEYVKDAEYGLVFEVEDDEFDPGGRVMVVPQDGGAVRPQEAGGHGPAIPFQFIDEEGLGFTESHGLIRLDGQELHLEFEMKDSVLGLIKLGVEEVRLPIEVVSQVRFKRGVLSARLTLQVDDLKSVENAPTSTPGRLRLKFKREDRDEAEELALALEEEVQHQSGY